VWRIFYDDGSTYSSDDGAWNNAPADGVLVVIEKVEPDRVLFHSGADYYVEIDGQIVATGDIGPILRKLGAFKFGRWTSHRRYEETSARARAEAKSWQR
jgi:hypothetical protein